MHIKKLNMFQLFFQFDLTVLYSPSRLFFPSHFSEMGGVDEVQSSEVISITDHKGTTLS
jgi:hypothetical protein